MKQQKLSLFTSSKNIQLIKQQYFQNESQIFLQKEVF